ncbi:hypothetical protein IWX49DRAFT_584224 [Phyllosticta citricarpa]
MHGVHEQLLLQLLGTCIAYTEGSLPLVPSRVDKKLLLVLRRPIWRLRAIVDVAAKGAAPGVVESRAGIASHSRA